MQTLSIFQSLWAMERRHSDGVERSLEENVEMIHKAGFSGVSTDYRNRDFVKRLAEKGSSKRTTCAPKANAFRKPSTS